MDTIFVVNFEDGLEVGDEIIADQYGPLRYPYTVHKIGNLWRSTAKKPDGEWIKTYVTKTDNGEYDFHFSEGEQFLVKRAR